MTKKRHKKNQKNPSRPTPAARAVLRLAKQRDSTIKTLYQHRDKLQSQSDQTFANSLYSYYNYNGRLTDAQWPYATELATKIKTFAYIEASRGTPAKPKNKDCYIYGVLRDNELKVGISTNPKKRLIGLQTGNAAKLHIAWTVLAPTRLKAKNIEARIHRQFKIHAMSGEWFHATISEEAEQMARTMAENHASGDRARWPVPAAASAAPGETVDTDGDSE